MGHFLISSSIGRKLIMGISGAFLVLFLTFHMVMNSVSIISADAYNAICEFLGASWYAIAGTGVLALGVIVHIAYGSLLTLMNLRARGKQRYEASRRPHGVAWSSQNMFVLGLVVLGGILLHLFNFWYNMQWVELTGEHVNQYGLSPTDGSGLVARLFSNPVYVIVYLLWFAAIWFHLTHGMWSMMQSVGWNNQIWLRRVQWISNIYVTLLMLGFASVVVVFYLKSLGMLQWLG